MMTVSRMAEFFQSGGLFMYPLVGLLVVGIAIAMERYLFLTSIKSSNRAVLDGITPYLKAGKFQAALQIMANSQSVSGQVLGCSLERICTTASRQEVAQTLAESLREIMPLLEKRTHVLLTLTHTAAMIGLLGSIVALSGLFVSVAGAEASVQTEVLLAGLPAAMSPMAFALGIAIPMFLSHSFLHSKTEMILDSLEVVSTQFLNTVEQRRTLARASGLAT